MRPGQAIFLEDEGRAFGTLVVSGVGEPLPLGLIYPGSPRGGKPKFTEYGGTFTGLDLPADGDIIAVPR